MDYIKIARVPNVTLRRLGANSEGTLHLTTYHLIFTQEQPTKREIWICYPIIQSVERTPYQAAVNYSTIRVRCKDFTFLSFYFMSDTNDEESKAVFESILRLTCVGSVEKLYAFLYTPIPAEKPFNSWNIYNPIEEFTKMGALTTPQGFSGPLWRVSKINHSYKLCSTYPSLLVVPSAISDNVLNHAASFRSKHRIPVLSYYHELTKCTITRCSQPRVGFQGSRSIQDEKIVAAIFNTTKIPNAVGSKQENLIVDCRPTANAMAQQALGAGSERMEHYPRSAQKLYLGIGNIHVMRESLNKVVEALKDGDILNYPPNRELLIKSGWLKHLSAIISGAIVIANTIHYSASHVLVHCSDGWDRTAQLSSLAQILLSSRYRTIDGFIILVEKEWLSFGHRFADRSGFVSHEKNFTIAGGDNQARQVVNNMSRKFLNQSHEKETSPVFHQFLDCVYQVLIQFPTRFEFNERFLRRLYYHLYSCQYGTFLFNSEHERKVHRVAERTRSVWDYFLSRRSDFTNSRYSAEEEAKIDAGGSVLLPDADAVRWWYQLFGRSNQDMNQYLDDSAVGDSSNSLSGFSSFSNVNLASTGRQVDGESASISGKSGTENGGNSSSARGNGKANGDDSKVPASVLLTAKSSTSESGAQPLKTLHAAPQDTKSSDSEVPVSTENTVGDKDDNSSSNNNEESPDKIVESFQSFSISQQELKPTSVFPGNPLKKYLADSNKSKSSKPTPARETPDLFNTNFNYSYGETLTEERTHSRAFARLD